MSASQAAFTAEEHGVTVHSRSAGTLQMQIAIDSLARGPALGGCRWLPYPSRAAARAEAVALAGAMTRKAALADLPLGGGKAVVMGDPATRTRDELLAFGSFVESLGGDYITAEDMGTSPADMAVIAERTRHVVGLPPERGGCGDPSPFTAEGVYRAIEAALGHRGRSLDGARIAVQGAGAVGGELIRWLVRGGASVVVADPDSARLAALPDVVERVAPDRILEQACDVLAPCGPPGVVGDAVAAVLSCEIVCGAANNPLADSGVASSLAHRGILYVPDFLANAGGLIHLSVAREGGSAEDTRARLAIIPENFATVMSRAETTGQNPLEVAQEIAEERVHPLPPRSGSSERQRE